MDTTQKDKRLFVSTIVLVVFHLVGIVGILSSYRDVFLHLTPFNLILSSALLFINQKAINKKFYIICAIVFTLGYLVELVGVKTGLIFGSYRYGSTLGYKLMDIPLIIGLNWLMLIFSVGCICHRIKASVYIKSLIGALMMVALDLLIEPVAMKYDFWQWKDSIIPLQNYVAWFLTSTILLILINKLDFDKNNKLAQALYITQMVFFSILCLN